MFLFKNHLNPPPGRTLESKQRKNKSVALLDLMTMDDPKCSSYPTYWTQYKVTHGKLGLALGIGQARPPKQGPRHNILTGKKYYYLTRVGQKFCNILEM